MQVIRDLWLCDDCTIVAVNGDYSGLDYYLNEKQAAERAAEIDYGLKRLPGLVPDDGDHHECRDCGWIGQRADLPYTELEDEEGDTCRSYYCCECNSDDIRERESGHDEFSTWDCACCFSGLAGSRTRFAQLIHEEEGLPVAVPVLGE